MVIGWGVITVGRHPDLKIVPAINSAEDSRVVAAYSRDIRRVEDFTFYYVYGLFRLAGIAPRL